MSLKETTNKLNNTPEYAGQVLTDPDGSVHIATDTADKDSWVKVAGLSYMRRTSGLTRGSTNTNVVIYGVANESNGSDITYVNSATDGDSFLINTSGIYSISAYHVLAASGRTVGIYVGTLSNTTEGAQIRAQTQADNNNFNHNTSWTGYLSASTQVWVSTNSALYNDANLNQITIARVA